MFDDLEPIATVQLLCKMFPRGVTREQVKSELKARDFAYVEARLVASASHESVLGYFLRTWTCKPAAR